MKSILLSIKPKYVELIASGEKTIEVRKTAPKCDVPFKCYIYCTSSDVHSALVVGYGDAKLIHCCNYKSAIPVGGAIGNGKVIGEFICDKLFLLHPYTYDGGNADLERRKFIQTFEGSSKENEILAATCLTQDKMFDYIGADNYGYGWHISDLKIYDKPKELREFFTPMGKRPSYMVERPPQSWQYMEKEDE